MRVSRSALAAAVVVLVAFAAPDAGRAAEVLVARPGDPAMPALPGPADLDLSDAEWRRVEAGDIVMQIVSPDEVHRQARAVGYLRHHPLWLFEISVDPAFTLDLVPEVSRIELLERRADGDVFKTWIDVSFLLPSFEYEAVSVWHPTRTGQAWALVRGDFERNDGSHSFLWDPVREQTLAVFTVDFALKGLLGMLPERFVLEVAGRALPGFMRRVDDMADSVTERDPERAARVADAWSELRPRLEAGDHPTRLWRGRAVSPGP